MLLDPSPQTAWVEAKNLDKSENVSEQLEELEALGDRGETRLGIMKVKRESENR